jgi:hypothetical protein
VGWKGGWWGLIAPLANDVHGVGSKHAACSGWICLGWRCALGRSRRGRRFRAIRQLGEVFRVESGELYCGVVHDLLHITWLGSGVDDLPMEGVDLGR